MFGGLCAGLIVADHLFNLKGVFELSNEPRALLSGAALIWLIGVLDDKFEIDALIKLGGQMIAAAVMVIQGLTILWLPIPGVGTVALTQWQGTLLTVALVVITINAVNFVDGLDGLAAGMVCIASAAFFRTPTASGWGTASRRRPPRRCSRRSSWACASVSCRTTCTRRGSSWATRARC